MLLLQICQKVLAMAASVAPANTVAEAIKRGNVVVFFDISMGGVPQGRLFMELFKDVAPKVREAMSTASSAETLTAFADM